MSDYRFYRSNNDACKETSCIITVFDNNKRLKNFNDSSFSNIWKIFAWSHPEFEQVLPLRSNFRILTPLRFTCCKGQIGFYYKRGENRTYLTFVNHRSASKSSYVAIIVSYRFLASIGFWSSILFRILAIKHLANTLHHSPVRFSSF